MIIYHIGRNYRYPGSGRKFKLKEVRGFIFEFHCGHFVTDCVFLDLIDCETGVQVVENNQLELFCV